MMKFRHGIATIVIAATVGGCSVTYGYSTPPRPKVITDVQLYRDSFYDLVYLIQSNYHVRNPPQKFINDVTAAVHRAGMYRHCQPNNKCWLKYKNTLVRIDKDTIVVLEGLHPVAYRDINLAVLAIYSR